MRCIGLLACSTSALGKFIKALPPVSDTGCDRKLSSEVFLIGLCSSYLATPSSPQPRRSTPSQTCQPTLNSDGWTHPLPPPPFPFLTLDTVSPVWCEDTEVPLLLSATGSSSSWRRGCSRDPESGYYHHQPPPTALLTRLPHLTH